MQSDTRTSPSRSIGAVRLVFGALPPFDVFEGIDVPELHRVVSAETPPPSPDVAEFAGFISQSSRPDAGLAMVAGLQRNLFVPVPIPELSRALFVRGRDDDMTAGIGELVERAPGSKLVETPGDHQGAIRSTQFASAVMDHLR